MFQIQDRKSGHSLNHSYTVAENTRKEREFGRVDVVPIIAELLADDCPLKPKWQSTEFQDSLPYFSINAVCHQFERRTKLKSHHRRSLFLVNIYSCQ